METCDVLIAGGGPAGSACARKLREAGLDVLVMDRSTFPRDKVCAGWITPQVIADLDIDTADYRAGRTFQPITGFRTGVIGGRNEVETSYGRAVSFGIRRCEFDHYLLQRASARLALGTPVASLRRDGMLWVVNERITAPMLVGAGGHFCPVARWLNGPRDGDPGPPMVVAQEAEFPIDPVDAAAFTVAPELPALYFCRDLAGYGWCFRKQHYVNIGVGRADPRGLPKAIAEFVAFLESTRTIPVLASRPWRGHAYLLHADVHRRLVDSGVLLVGDAAGLAYPQSGEGIRTAIESGLLAAMTVIEARGRYTRDRLQPYESRLQERFGVGMRARAVTRLVPSCVSASLGRALLGVPAFVRHVALDRWFLHANDPPLVVGSPPT